MAAGNEMRVSDAEREAAAAELREHFASGRLSADELDERLSAVFAAKTRADLNALFTDLPSSGRGWAGAATGQPGGTGPSGSFSGGPFGGGPFGGGPFSSGPFGPGPFAGGPFGPGASGPDAGWQAPGAGFRASAGHLVARIVVTSALMWALLILGILGIFGIGTGRPIGVVLIMAAFMLLKRLVYIFTGRRGQGRGRGRGGPRRRR